MNKPIFEELAHGYRTIPEFRFFVLGMLGIFLVCVFLFVFGMVFPDSAPMRSSGNADIPRNPKESSIEESSNQS